MTDKIQKLLSFINSVGLVRSKDVVRNGFTRAQIAELLRAGEIEQVSRGLYKSKGDLVLPNMGLAEISARYPKVVFCLLSALQFHQITTQLPHEIWCAIEGSTRAPQVDYPPLRVIRFVGKAYSEGIEEHKISGIMVRIYSPAKTVADLFRFRNKIGLDVAMEALKETIRTKKASLDEIRKMAQLRGVYTVMRPYIEMEISS
jgi:predicted transcriptional regulator of viral defense system